MKTNNFTKFQEDIFSTSHSSDGTESINTPLGESVFMFMLSDIKRNSVVLDLGCNDGGFTDFLRLLNFKNITGIDLPKVIEIAKKKYPNTNFKSFDLSKEFEINSNTVDCIIALGVMEHLIDDKLFLRECNRVLKKDGYFILMVPNKFYYIHRLFTFFGIDWKEEAHIHFYSFKTMSNLLEQNNFKIINKKGFIHEQSKFKKIEKFLPKNFRFQMLFVCKKVVK